MDSIISLSLAAVTVVKVVVDAVRMAGEVPKWAPPALAMLCGPAVVLLLLVAEGQVVTQALAAQSVLAGVLAGGAAIGVNEMSKRVKPTS